MDENSVKILIGFDKVGEDLYREIDCIINFFREKGNEINDKIFEIK